VDEDPNAEDADAADDPKPFDVVEAEPKAAGLLACPNADAPKPDAGCALDEAPNGEAGVVALAPNAVGFADCPNADVVAEVADDPNAVPVLAAGLAPKADDPNVEPPLGLPPPNADAPNAPPPPPAFCPKPDWPNPLPAAG
jgi:hypothetical protein